MKLFKGLSGSTKAFTLIELLVVISIIAVLAAGVGIALRGNNPEASLRSAQSLAVGALSAARGQAALTQSNARIIVQGDINKDDFLRTIRIVTLDATTGTWKQAGGNILLPEGIYVVPSSTLTGVTLDTVNGTWNAARSSSLFNPGTAGVNGITDSDLWMVSKDISPLGTVEGGRIVVTSGRRSSPTTLVLDNASAVRGLDVSRYGVASLINEPASFD